MLLTPGFVLQHWHWPASCLLKLEQQLLQATCWNWSYCFCRKCDELLQLLTGCIGVKLTNFGLQMQAYENLKRRAKKAAAEDKVERLRTGGGTFVPQVSINDEKLLAILGNSAKPLSNVFDSDAAYHDTGIPCFELKIWFLIINTNIQNIYWIYMLHYSCSPNTLVGLWCILSFTHFASISPALHFHIL